LDGEPRTIREKKIATNKLFSQALQYYRAHQFEDALKTFKDIHLQSPDDLATKLYIDRCLHFIENGIPKDWDGSETWTTK
jgi:cytochrome b involved in lipid metabolism